MALKAFNIDIDKMLADLGKIEDDIKQKAVKQALEIGATAIITLAQKRAPRGFGNLANDDFLDPVSLRSTGGKVKYGFGASTAGAYAKTMDTGFDVDFIRPKRAKALYIPLSNRAKRRGAQGTSARAFLAKSNKGLKYGVDFVFAQRVKTPKAVEGGHIGRDGQPKGPNLFFTGAQKKINNGGRLTKIMKKAINRSIARSLQN